MRVYGSRRMSDHAGQRTTSFNPSSIGRGKDAGTGCMTRDRYNAFMRDVRRRSAEPAWTKFIGGLMVLLIFLTAPIVVMDALEFGINLDTIKQGIWLVVFTLIGLYAFTTHGLTHETMVKELLARSHCASCGFDLNSIPASDSDLTVCPECGCRWRIASEVTPA